MVPCIFTENPWQKEYASILFSAIWIQKVPMYPKYALC